MDEKLWQFIWWRTSLPDAEGDRSCACQKQCLMFDSVCCSHLGAIVTMHVGIHVGLSPMPGAKGPSPAGSTVSQIFAASSKVLHVQVLRDVCIYIGSQNRVIDTALLFVPGSACLLTVSLLFSMLHSTTALRCRCAVSSRFKSSNETCVMLIAGQHTCWNSGKCVQHHQL